MSKLYGYSIFKNSFGLTHFPSGDEQTLTQSVTQHILKSTPLMLIC